MTTDPTPPAAPPDTEQPRCSYPGPGRQGFRCPVTENLFEIQYSERDDDNLLSCRAHLGELIDTAAIPPQAGQSWFMSIVYRYQSPDRLVIHSAGLPVLAEHAANRPAAPGSEA